MILPTQLFYVSCILLFAAQAQAVTIATVPVGNAGNANDATGFGAVNLDFRIGTTEVTNAQYAEFLNAKAAADPLALFDSQMGTDSHAGITRSGVGGSFTYEVKANMDNKPVNYVNWYDAIRFANWLHNGQGSGDTETGAYTLLGGTPTPSNAHSITRSGSATWFLTSENEWYKAAYHQPASLGGDTNSYWLYPTASNSAPTVATADGVGDISNPGVNVANYAQGARWNDSNIGNVTTVASAGPLSTSFYGTADQGGNVWEWNEALISSSFSGLRGLRGGSWFDTGGSGFHLASTTRSDWDPTDTAGNFGFRVATLAAAPIFPGDFNDDDTVDAADYVVWRNQLGSATSLPNDATSGVDASDYGVWQANFGANSSIGASQLATVPEPNVFILSLVAMLCILTKRKLLG